jgi:hypothetical protein
MVKASDRRRGDDSTGVRRFDGTRNRSISVERHVRPIIVVIGGRQPNQAQQVTLP